jgi:hypothetical protein
LALFVALGGGGRVVDAETNSDSLGDFAEIAVYTVSVEVDVDPEYGVCSFCGCCGGEAAVSVDLGWCGAGFAWWNGDILCAHDVVG